MALLEVSHLHTYFHTRRGTVKAVNDVSFTVGEGRTLGLVGESGSGKSVTAMSILRLLDGNGAVESGRILFAGQDLLERSAEEMYQVRGRDISVIFQEPMTSLNPVFTVEKQLREVLVLHEKLDRGEAGRRVISLLDAVRIPHPQQVAKQYPHQLSGGMRQRVMIAMALACRPKLLIADEPTTALDVTIQAQILRLIGDLRRDSGMSVLLITHDLAVISQMCDDVAVLYCGQVVEQAEAHTLFGASPVLHPYTEGLMKSVPRLDTPVGARLEAIPGTVPHPLALPEGCKFAPRCKYSKPRCHSEEPPLAQVGDQHWIRCFYPASGGEK